MVKTMSFQEKIEKLAEWIPQILEEIKREIKRDHLRKAPIFSRRFFAGKNINTITTEEIVTVYTSLMKSGDSDFLDQIGYLWQLKHPELHPFFESNLKTISPNVSEITKIDDVFAAEIVEEAVTKFGAVNTYLFALLYEVALSDALFDNLRERAFEETRVTKIASEQEEEARNCEQLRMQHERLMARMREKYEKKLTALEDKYHTDVGRLRQELAELRQTGLNGPNATTGPCAMGTAKRKT